MALPPHVARSARRIAEALGVPGDSAVVADALDLLERAGVQPGGGMNGRCVIGAALYISGRQAMPLTVRDVGAVVLGRVANSRAASSRVLYAALGRLAPFANTTSETHSGPSIVLLVARLLANAVRPACASSGPPLSTLSRTAWLTIVRRTHALVDLAKRELIFEGRPPVAVLLAAIFTAIVVETLGHELHRMPIGSRRGRPRTIPAHIDRALLDAASRAGVALSTVRTRMREVFVALRDAEHSLGLIAGEDGAMAGDCEVFHENAHSLHSQSCILEIGRRCNLSPDQPRVEHRRVFSHAGLPQASVYAYADRYLLALQANEPSSFMSSHGAFPPISDVNQDVDAEAADLYNDAFADFDGLLAEAEQNVRRIGSCQTDGLLARDMQLNPDVVAAVIAGQPHAGVQDGCELVVRRLLVSGVAHADIQACRTLGDLFALEDSLGAVLDGDAEDDRLAVSAAVGFDDDLLDSLICHNTV